MEELARLHSPYPVRRSRAEHLRRRHSYAAEVLTLYLAVLDVQEEIFQTVRERPVGAGSVKAYVGEHVLPRVLEVTLAAGPPKLAAAVVGRFHSADLEDVVDRWLRGREQSITDSYLARAASAPVLEALPSETVAAICEAAPGEAVSSRPLCPRCSGLPQLSYFALSGEALVTGPRYLLCARCSHSWMHSRMCCAACGEASTNRLLVYTDGEQLPHLRVDACDSCRRYLLAVDLRKDAAAVPLVDELAAIPLDLFATERGLSKVVPNLMGF
jgi:formate dehydrogenase accessory protein FdhE